ncbi:Asp23/Gls24 family envelope stress response protein [Phytohabitans rumicis]|uniref:Asp23/Gls24 family envelope stress response protein n=1 Tax=Phytohabitans rumicis TaxID=1076125 RepID=A0A6V8L113_9ACTN|nr:Asp23/Gls24 family envelope stress response protein [Phytohabitans rumicis]GFJ89280.1 hypothetical protein Prum_029220 [Phytohabitans rumicis]
MTDVAAQVPTQRQEEAVEEVSEAPAPEAANDAIGTANDAMGTANGAIGAVNGTIEQVSDAVERAAAASGRVASQVVDRLRNNAELAAERGTTSIADEVVEKIAGIAVREVPGVYDLGGDVARFFANVKERIGLGDADDDADRGMSVRLEGRSAAINITLVIEYGFVVHSVTEKVRAKVIGSVENLLGLEVTEVNIRVDDVHVEDSGPVSGDEARAAGYSA